MKYHLNILIGNIELPEEMQGDYDSYIVAYNVLFAFVHRFDKKKDVIGQVRDKNNEVVAIIKSNIDDKF